MNLIAPAIAAEINTSSISKGDSIALLGTVTGTDIVDIVLVGPEGLKELPSSFYSEDAISDGLYFTASSVSDCEFEETIRIPEEAVSGNYQLFVFILGRDGWYALTTREEGELFDAVLDYGWVENDFVGHNQSQIIAMLEEATSNTPGSDDIATNLSFTVRGKTVHNVNTSENFETIQAAIDDADTVEGHTIAVDSGTYYENVNVNKQLILMGVDTGTGKPVVDAGGSGSAITLSADGITLEGFTAKNSGSGDAGIEVTSNKNTISGNNASNNSYWGIFLYSSCNNTITNSTVRNNWCGIYLFSSCNNNTITACNISNNHGGGIYLYSSSNNIITGNKVKSNYWGISLDSSNNNAITGNTASYNNNLDGIRLYSSSNNNITDNTVSNNNRGGFYLTINNKGNTITRNTASYNDYGIYLSSSSKSIIYLNNFMNNTYSVQSSQSDNIWNSTEKITYTYNGSTYTNYLGNYMDDYSGIDADGDGIDDTLNVYLLMEPWENYFAPTDFDTEAGTYPSIMGTHNGTITPSYNITVSKLYTYACAGTGGHTESIELYDKNGIPIANGTWNGYQSDWHNITIHNLTGGSPYVTLLKNHEYRYIIKTGSYPQIIHESSKDVTGGTITCTSFEDANGKVHYDWIPAIRLF